MFFAIFLMASALPVDCFEMDFLDWLNMLARTVAPTAVPSSLFRLCAGSQMKKFLAVSFVLVDFWLCHFCVVFWVKVTAESRTK